MNKLPLVSIIVPVYNVEKYLPTCLDSIINQSYQNLEIILVDDGSPDNCGKICDQYAAQDSRIKVIHKENGGLSDARNKGLDIISGEYISFIDSDDFIHPQFIEILYKCIQENGTQVAFCDFISFQEEKHVVFQKELNKESYQVFYSNDFLETIYDHWQHVVVWNKLYHRDIFKNIRFDKGLIHEDELIFTDIYKQQFTIGHIKNNLYFYRDTPNSITKQKASELKMKSLVAVYQKRLNFYSNYKPKMKRNIKISKQKLSENLGGYYSLVSRSGLDFFLNVLLNRQILLKQKLKLFLWNVKNLLQ